MMNCLMIEVVSDSNELKLISKVYIREKRQKTIRFAIS